RVVAESADLNRVQRYLNYACSFSPKVSVWRERSYKNGFSFAAQTFNAERAVQRNRSTDYILQFQAMFSPMRSLERLRTPFGIYTDYTVAMARREYELWAPFKTDREYLYWHRRGERLYRRARHASTCSNPARKSVIEDFGVAAERVHCVRAGTPFQPVERPAARSEVKKFLLVGRDYKRKGVDTLLQAFSRVRAKHPQIELTVVG